MTKDVIAMAREAGFAMENSAAIQAAERFAKLVGNAKLDQVLHIIARHPTDSTRNEIMELIESLKEPTT